MHTEGKMPYKLQFSPIICFINVFTTQTLAMASTNRQRQQQETEVMTKEKQAFILGSSIIWPFFFY